MKAINGMVAQIFVSKVGDKLWSSFSRIYYTCSTLFLSHERDPDIASTVKKLILYIRGLLFNISHLFHRLQVNWKFGWKT